MLLNIHIHTGVELTERNMAATLPELRGFHISLSKKHLKQLPISIFITSSIHICFRHS